MVNRRVRASVQVSDSITKPLSQFLRSADALPAPSAGKWLYLSNEDDVLATANVCFDADSATVTNLICTEARELLAKRLLAVAEAMCEAHEISRIIIDNKAGHIPSHTLQHLGYNKQRDGAFVKLNVAFAA